MLNDFYKYCSRELAPHTIRPTLEETIRAADLKNGARLEFTRKLTGFQISQILEECKGLDSETNAKVEKLLRGPIARIRNSQIIDAHLQS